MQMRQRTVRAFSACRAVAAPRSASMAWATATPTTWPSTIAAVCAVKMASVPDAVFWKEAVT